MNPPSEQLVRDYLNRLSVAARGRLGHKDRQGLLERTRARIEVESGGLRDASAEQVRRALAALGEPIALVEKERGRIAATAANATTAARKDAGIAGLFAGRKNGVIRQIWPADGDGAPVAVGPRASAAGGEAGFDVQVPGQRPVTGGASVPAAVSIAEVAGTPAGLDPSGATVSGGVPVPVGSAVPSWPRESNGEPRRAGQPGRDGGAAAAGGPEADGSPRRNGISPGPPLPRRAPAEEGDAGAGTPTSPPGPPAGRSSEPVVSPAPSPDATPGGGGDEGDEPASGVEFTISDAGPIEEYAEGGWMGGLGGVLLGWLGRLGGELAAVVARDRLESVAIVLLGIGGAAYPPIWLIGVAVALFSKKWDHRDKWLGLAVPVLLVVFGAMLVVVLGGERESMGPYVMEFWLAAGRLSRLAALLGAGFLLRRAISYHGKPGRRRPPWSQPGATG